VSDLFKLFPPYLMLLTIVLVISPTIVSALLRITLYKNLVDQTQKVRMLLGGNDQITPPIIVDKLRKRFQTASQQLEQVNTTALIDGIYPSQYDRVDYFCRVLPNLLLAFGLLGTFLGITLNLSNLSQTILQNGANINNLDGLLKQLQQPLQGMGIAFITSLIAVACSSILTVINLFCNTSLAKYQLISSLEDYLDNVYQPTIPGHTRMDKTVDRLVSEFTNFLTRFRETVRDAVESSLKEEIGKIEESATKAHNLAKEVNERFMESSGTISAAANEFKQATAQFSEAGKHFQNSNFPERLSHTTMVLATKGEQFNQSINTFCETVEAMTINLNKIDQSIHDLVKSVEITNRNNEQLTSSIDAQVGNNNQQMQEVVEQVSQSVESLREIEDKLTELTENRLIEVLSNHTSTVNERIQKMSELLIIRVSEQVGSNNNLLSKITEKAEHNNVQIAEMVEYLGEYVSHLSDIKSELYELIQVLQEKQENLLTNSTDDPEFQELKKNLDNI
jgi:methyl-accepting chemotaxis protein